MTRFIDKDQALANPFMEIQNQKKSNNHFLNGIWSYNEYIQNRPTVDIQEGYIVSFDAPETAADIISAALTAYDAGLYELPDNTVQSAADLLNLISLHL